jgi:gamma-glutamyltranspeptidase/glutathione hydrolase
MDASHCRFAVTPEMWVNKVIGANPDGWGFSRGKVNDAGYTSVCTPGWVRDATILDRWGTISAHDAPAARIARAKVSEALSRLFRRKSPSTGCDHA